MTAATAGDWLAFTPGPNIRKSTVVTERQSTGHVPWLAYQESATMELPRIITAAGSGTDPMSSVVLPASETEFFDDLDREIARMTDAEILALIKSGAGMWADRDDLDDLMDRSDRMDQLYGNTSENPDPSV